MGKRHGGVVSIGLRSSKLDWLYGLDSPEKVFSWGFSLNNLVIRFNARLSMLSTQLVYPHCQATFDSSAPIMGEMD